MHALNGPLAALYVNVAHQGHLVTMQFKVLAFVAALVSLAAAQADCVTIINGSACPVGYRVCGPVQVGQTKCCPMCIWGISEESEFYVTSTVFNCQAKRSDDFAIFQPTSDKVPVNRMTVLTPLPLSGSSKVLEV
ncbi:hypothetical protein GGX14DRAFT_391543 [Mycena pura]|uniref:Uncharacterized protein n=1 Tax=Mycena pura TaxID=153505 RepID=A0AAD6YGG2_9AGAR|nr:hypothetical protein GGX14DRAFT_391543 [Mycena pura]